MSHHYFQSNLLGAHVCVCGSPHSYVTNEPSHLLLAAASCGEGSRERGVAVSQTNLSSNPVSATYCVIFQKELGISKF